jgi:hypothetical protein
VSDPLPSYAVMFRGHPACPCQVQWLPALEAEAQRRGLLTGPLPISQLIGGAKQSGGTHVDGGESDFYPLTAFTQVDGEGGLVWLCRQMGADPTWHRPIDWDGHNGVEHVHSGLVGCPHNVAAAGYQLVDVRAGLNGLANRGKDDGPRPLSGRTWQQGIDWAKEQEQMDENRMREIAREEIENFKVDVGGTSKVKLPALLQRLWERTKKAGQ